MSSAENSFRERIDAGCRLAPLLADLQRSNALVLGLARGGVVVAAAVAEALNLALQALVVRKLGAPRNPELAIGAVSETGVQWIDTFTVQMTGASAAYIREEVERQVTEAKRRQREYQTGPGLERVPGRTVVVIDDGIATGASALVALRSLRELGAAQITLATPTASTSALKLLAPYADRVETLLAPDPFLAVGQYYRNFAEVTDAEVIQYLRVAQERTRRDR